LFTVGIISSSSLIMSALCGWTSQINYRMSVRFIPWRHMF